MIAVKNNAGQLIDPRTIERYRATMQNADPQDLVALYSRARIARPRPTITAQAGAPGGAARFNPRVFNLGRRIAAGPQFVGDQVNALSPSVTTGQVGVAPAPQVDENALLQLIANIRR